MRAAYMQNVGRARRALVILGTFVVAQAHADVSVLEVHARASEFIVRMIDGRELRGEQVKGLTLSIPGWPTVRIASVSRDATSPDVLLYDFERKDAATGNWVEACEPNSAGERIPLARLPPPRW